MTYARTTTKATLAPSRRPPLRRFLLHSVSMTALVVAGAAPARAGTFRSITQALNNTQAAVAAAATAGGAAAANQAGLGAQNAANAAAKFRSLAQALEDKTYTGAVVPDGVAPGGLVQAPGVSSNPGTLWTGANPTLGVSTSGTLTSVTVTQTSSLANLNWQTFNVGAHTKLIFDESAGGSLASSWVAINTVTDPNENPSVILGQIVTVNNTKGDSADVGKVYILNTNGILFGAGAQINVGALVATTAVIAQAQFTTNAAGTVTAFNLYGSATGTAATDYYTPTFTDTLNGQAGGTVYTPGSVIVQAGASISTPAPASTSTAAGGYVMLIGGTVQNAGEISTPGGQTILGAGDRFALQAGYSPTANPTATTVGSTIDTTLTGLNASGVVLNTGIIAAEQGDITFVGHALTQDGIVLATTTVDQRGTVHFLTPTNDATASVTLGADSITEILPQDNGETANDAQRAANLAASNGTPATATALAVEGDNQLRISQIIGAVHLNTENTLADTLGESRIEISSGGNVDVQGGALALAQGGQVAVAAGGQILLESGSTLDVSGVNATLAASANNLNIASIVPYYLRDSGGNRTGALEFDNVTLDQRLLQDVSYGGSLYTYTQGGLLEVSGNLVQIQHGINEWASIAGQVTLQAQQTATGSNGGTVVAAPGSVINLTGGTVTYQAGLVQQSYVITTTGQIYNINNAPGDLVYAGVYTGVAENHARWKIDDTYVNPLLTPSEIMQSAYTIGRDAGTLTISAPTAAIDGTIYAGVTVGSIQGAAQPANVSDSFLLAQNVVPLAGVLQLGDYATGIGSITSPFQSNIILANGGSPSGTVTVVPETVAGTVSIASDALSAAGLSSIILSTAGDISVQGAITAADGGSVVLSGQTIEDDASITARSGHITLSTLQPGSNAPAGTLTTAGITVAGNVTLNASGDWTNLTQDPTAANAGGHANGGTVSIVSAGSAILATGSTIDVSSGGLLIAGKLTTAAGGSVNISGDIIPGTLASAQAFLPVELGSTIIGYGTGGAGTLSIAAPDIILTSNPGNVYYDTLQINPSLLSTGFASYDLNGYFGVTVPDGQNVTATRPVYTLNNAAGTGAAPESVFNVVLPSLYQQIKGTDSLTQRAGASLTLSASVNPQDYNGGGGPLTVGQGASITVDPGQSINLNAYGQITINGTVTAHGGTITVANTLYDQTSTTANADTSNYVDGLSVWLGSDSVLDASGLSVVMTDALGRRFGLAQSGGTILLGGLGGLTASSQLTTYAQVIERPGAIIDASGASAVVNVQQGLQANEVVASASPITLVGNGGTIVARSYDGIALDGTVVAAAGGRGAAGGALVLRLDPEDDGNFDNLPVDVVTPQQIIVSQNAIAGQPATGIAPGDPSDPATLNIAHISQAQITAGGFDSVTLAAPDGVLLDGNVNLQVGRSLYLQSGLIGDTQANASGSFTAPYISITGYTSSGTDPNQSVPQLTGAAATGTLTFNAGLIDFTDQIALGGERGVGNAVVNGVLGTQVTASAYGFGQTDFLSSGDIRFNDGELGSSGNLLFRAAQLYPTTSLPGDATVFKIYAGDNPNATGTTNEFAGGTLTVQGLGGAAPAVPYSVGGTLALVAETIIQDGIIRAPLGEIRLGSTDENDSFSGKPDTQITNSVTLAPGSVTSVSLDGLTVPYGGTVDGVNYYFGGTAVTTFSPAIEIDSAALTAAKGSTVDISGGGTLAGAAFVFGRGGSADVNLTPLLNTSTGTVTAGSSSDQIYAILPGFTGSVAPTSPGNSGYDTPQIGEQITVKAGEVAGLAAGTYTLLPAYYDLLPGAFRVELTSAADTTGPGVSYGNYTTVAGVQVGIANTGVEGQIPVAALFTPTAGVQQLAQYDQENYSTFEINSAATFGAPQPFLPQDASTFRLVLNAPTTGLTDNDQPVSIAAGVLQQAPVSGFYAGTVEISGTVPLEILGAGDSVAPVVNPAGSQPVTSPGVGLQAGMLDALDIARLVIGGTLTVNSSIPNVIEVQGVAPDVEVLPGATLTAADIILTGSTSAFIDITRGATLSTLGQSANLLDLTAGYYFNTDSGTSAFPVLNVSSGQVVFTPNVGDADGATVLVNTGAALLASGSLNFIAPSGTSVAIGQAELGGKYVNLQVANINIGSDAALAADANVLPSGLSLDTAALATLVGGDSALGVPAAISLNLTANQSVNFVGSVALNSGTTDLTLYSPAIYGFGAATDMVSITAPVFTWGGVTSLFSTGVAGASTIVSATPGGQIFGSANNVIGNLTINANTIVIGYGNGAQANDQTVLDHALVGFSNVTLNAADSITANNQQALSVYATEKTIGTSGSGGDLTLNTPLLTNESGAVLEITAGGTLSAAAPAAPAATGTIATLGGQINLTAADISLNTAIALPAGRLNVTSGNDITLGADSNIDLSGRATALFDQIANSGGGTLNLQAYTATAGAGGGSITQDAGGTINVSSPGAAAGVITASALGGTVTLGGTLLGGGAAGYGGFFNLQAAAIGGGGFDGLNTTLDQGSFFGARTFELSAGSLTVDQTVTANQISIATDAGDLTITGTLNASGAGPGTITLSAGGNLTLAATSLLDAHATTTAVDSYGETINAENQAQVTLTSTGGTVTLAPGASINVSYPGAIAAQTIAANTYAVNNFTLAAGFTTSASFTTTVPVLRDGVVLFAAGATVPAGTSFDVGDIFEAGTELPVAVQATVPLGQVVINAPRTSDSAAVSATGSLNITGAAAIDLYAFQTYSPTDANGTIVQDNGSTGVTNSAGTLGLNQINTQSIAFMQAVDVNSTLTTQLAGLAAYGSDFNFAPGVAITSSGASNGNLTVSGDLDFAAFRYSDPTGFGIAATTVLGSGEPGSVVFRASNDLIINGSITDGFGTPPDEPAADGGLLTGTTTIVADTGGWVYPIKLNGKGVEIAGSDPDNADILLPSSTLGIYDPKGATSAETTSQVELAAGTSFSTVRPISLNYAITIDAAMLHANVVIPFSFLSQTAVTVPGGGFIATAPISRTINGVPTVLFKAGQFVPGGTVFAANTYFHAGSVLPVQVEAHQNTTVPAGTLLDVFVSSTVELLLPTAVLPDNALIPAGTAAIFQGIFNGTTQMLTGLEYRAVSNGVQGYTYALAAMLPAGDLSWSMDFTAGANLAAANPNAVLPTATLAGGVGLATPNTINQDPGSLLIDDQHYFVPSTNPNNAVAGFSVIRTGTGDLSLNAGGSIDQSSLYGIYTAGTQTSLGSAEDTQFDTARFPEAANGISIISGGPTLNLLVSQYQAYYPTGGGNVSIIAGGDITGNVVAPLQDASDTAGSTDSIGNWLWRQGSTQLNQPTSWWINFGTLVDPLTATGASLGGNAVALVGFQGIGALGGGNVTVVAGGDAGQINDLGANHGQGDERGEGLVIAIGGSGRLVPGQTNPLVTGGGLLTLDIAGTLNGEDEGAYGLGAGLNGNTGTLDPVAAGLNGDLINLRGNIDVTAGAIGRVDLAYNFTSDLFDPRSGDPFSSNNGVADGGITLAPGDGTVNIDTQRDLVISGASDPGRVIEQNYTSVDVTDPNDLNGGGDTGFTLWQASTAIRLFSGGGNVTPTTVPEESLPGPDQYSNDDPTDFRSIYPPSLFVTAASGSIIYGLDNVALTTPSNGTADGAYPFGTASLETMPAANGQVEFLAEKSIYANSYAIDISGANPADLSTPSDPAFTTDSGDPAGSLTNIRPNGGTNQSADALFALQADTPTTNLHADDTAPALFYAVTGDIVNFQTGETITFNADANETLSQWYIAAKPIWVIAGGDIVSSGTRPSSYPSAAVFATQENQTADLVYGGQGGQTDIGYTSGNLVLNNSADSISVFSAGRDILSSYVYVGGPGTLEVSAGRDIYQAAYSVGGEQQLFFGAFKSLGDDLITGSPLSTTAGANIDVLAGVGSGPDYTGFADYYFSAAELQNFSAVDLPGATTATGTSASFITTQYNGGAAASATQIFVPVAALLAQALEPFGYKISASIIPTSQQAGLFGGTVAWTVTQAEALLASANSFYQTLPTVAQDAVVRDVFFKELAASGTEYSTNEDNYYRSYGRGRFAIDTLFPGANGQTTPTSGVQEGIPAGYAGGITMFSGTVSGVTTNGTTPATFDGGIATLFGGNVQVVDPGGPVLLGIGGGPAPGNSSGIVTYGSGDIDIFSLGSVLLGQSRIFTTSGGNILIWAADGDINAGVAVQTTVVFNPPLLDYDNVGDITETPPASSSGGGIATLQPLPQVPPGDISLIAPAGTIDAGEAGIRVSGNLVLAAARVVGAANISVKGSTSGVAATVSTSAGEAEAAGAAAGSSTNAEQNSANRNNNDQNQASVVEVEVVSIGGTYEEEKKKRKRATQ